MFTSDNNVHNTYLWMKFIGKQIAFYGYRNYRTVVESIYSRGEMSETLYNRIKDTLYIVLHIETFAPNGDFK